MKQDSFNFMLMEWRYQETVYYSELFQGQLFTCPSCQEEPQTIHIDGNSKLFRYKAAGRYENHNLLCYTPCLVL